MTFTIPMTMRPGDPGDLVLRNVARVSATPLGPAQQRADCVAGSVEQLAGGCAAAELFRVGLDVSKDAFLASDTSFMTPLPAGAALEPGTPVVWRYTVRNSGSVALEDITVSDAAVETRADDSGTTTTPWTPVIECPDDPAVTPGATVRIPELAGGASLVCWAEGVIGSE